MSKEKLGAIANYLSEKMGNVGVEQKHDFDRGAQTFKLHVGDGSRLLKVSDEFVADNGIAEILRRFDQWSLAEVLMLETQRGIHATNRGLETFERQ